MNETEQMRVLADQLFLYLKPKFKDLTRDNLKYFRAEVVNNPGGGKLEISRPLDQTTMVLPCMPALYSAVSGDQVTVFVFGNLSNAVVVSNGTFSADVDMAAIAQMIADAVSGKADTNSPTFTGTPRAPTAPAGTSTTQIATTGFVANAINTAIADNTYDGSVEVI